MLNELNKADEAIWGEFERIPDAVMNGISQKMKQGETLEKGGLLRC